jgi:hypothetical protein
LIDRGDLEPVLRCLKDQSEHPDFGVKRFEDVPAIRFQVRAIER